MGTENTSGLRSASVVAEQKSTGLLATHTDVLKTHESQRVSSDLRENKKIRSKISDKIQLLYNECRGCTVVELLVTWIFCIWEEKKKIVSRVLDFFGSNITFLFLCGECATNTKISDRRLLSIDIFVFVKRERHTKRIGIKT